MKNKSYTLTPEQEMKILGECIDKNQCEKVFQQYLNLIRAVAEKIYRKKGIPFTSEDIEDRMQDVFEALFKNNKQKLRQYDPKHKNKKRLKGWIILISTQTILDYFKRRKEFLNITDEKIRIPAEDMDMILKGINPGNGSNAEIKCMLADAIKNLPPDQKLVIKLEYYKGLSASEIGRLTGKMTNNIYQIKRRALENIRKSWCD